MFVGMLSCGVAYLSQELCCPTAGGSGNADIDGNNDYSNSSSHGECEPKPPQYSNWIFVVPASFDFVATIFASPTSLVRFAD